MSGKVDMGTINEWINTISNAGNAVVNMAGNAYQAFNGNGGTTYVQPSQQQSSSAGGSGIGTMGLIALGVVAVLLLIKR